LIQQKLQEGRSEAVESCLALLQGHSESLWSIFNHDNSFSIEKKAVTEDLSQLVGQQSNVGGARAEAAAFLTWAEERNIRHKLALHTFNGLRGCAAPADICPGETILSVPNDVLLYDETVLQTDAGKMLSAIPNLSMDNVLIIFSMIDRFDESSVWREFWRELPDAFQTGISFPSSLTNLLDGTAAHLEITKAQNHIRQQYASCEPLFDALVTAYPQHLTKEMFSYDNYVWSVELWYSYAFEVSRWHSNHIQTIWPVPCSNVSASS